MFHDAGVRITVSDRLITFSDSQKEWCGGTGPPRGDTGCGYKGQPPHYLPLLRKERISPLVSVC